MYVYKMSVYTHISHIFFIHPLMDTLVVSCFGYREHGLLMALWISVLVFLEKILRSEIAGLYSSPLFIFLSNLHTIFPSGRINLHFYLKCMMVYFSQHPHQCLLFIVILIIVIQTDIRWNVIVFLICISLMMSDFEHLSMCLLVICMSSLEKCPFRYSAHFLISFFGFWL